MVRVFPPHQANRTNRAPQSFERLPCYHPTVSRNHKECSICEKPGAAGIVNTLLEKNTFLKVIAQQTGFSKSSIHRHSQKCVIRAQAQKLKSSRFNSATDRLLVKWADDPSAPPDVRGKMLDGRWNEISPDQKVRETDVVLLVQYEKTKEFGNPRALSADASRDLAYAENVERDAAKQISVPEVSTAENVTPE
jgi:hypothetical protein